MASDVFFTVKISRQKYAHQSAGAQAMFKAGLKRVERAVQRDVLETFEKEGALSGHNRWPPLSPEYARRKAGALKGRRGRKKKASRDSQQVGSSKILRRTSTLFQRATTGILEIIDPNVLAVGYRMNTTPGGPGTARLPIYSQAHMSGARGRGGKGGRRSTIMPARTYVRLSNHTTSEMAAVWAGQIIDRFEKSVFSDMARMTRVRGSILGSSSSPLSLRGG